MAGTLRKAQQALPHRVCYLTRIDKNPPLRVHRRTSAGQPSRTHCPRTTARRSRAKSCSMSTRIVMAAAVVAASWENV